VNNEFLSLSDEEAASRITALACALGDIPNPSMHYTYGATSFEGRPLHGYNSGNGFYPADRTTYWCDASSCCDFNQIHVIGYCYCTGTSSVGTPVNFGSIVDSCSSYVDATPSPTTAGVGAAIGDPHLQNVHGERFDLMKAGKHVLINIPRGKDAEHALLCVQADARWLGSNCADLYFQELNVTGSWAEATKAGGYHYSVSQNDVQAPEWVAFGKVELKVVHGRTQRGSLYLNMYAKHLRRAGFPIGGLLGEDDHDDVVTPPEACAERLALSKSNGGRHSATSRAAASFE